MSVEENPNLSHHTRYEYCRTRLKYRQGKCLTAVKVYTIINESKHLLIFGVPKINLHNEIKRKLSKIGDLEKFECITNLISKEMNLEIFTDCYHVIFNKLQHARKAKKLLDAKEFYGGILHITYGTEYENIDDIRKKINQRKSEVNFRIKINKELTESINENQSTDSPVTETNNKFKKIN